MIGEWQTRKNLRLIKGERRVARSALKGGKFFGGRGYGSYTSGSTLSTSTWDFYNGRHACDSTGFWFHW